MDNRPIGIFDSGMGGLTVRAEIARALPHESLVYFGDGKNVPYGPRSQEEIVGFVDDAVGQLLAKDVKMVVVACNAATGAAIDHLRAKYDIPIIGMEPAVKPAALTTRSGVIGVLATAAALNGELYRATAARYADDVRIVERVGEGFVELVERDLEDTPEALEVVRRAVEPVLETGADRIVLGCTHYPYLARQIRRVIDNYEFDEEATQHKVITDGGLQVAQSAGREKSTVQIIDSGAAIARRVEQLLTEGGLHAAPEQEPEHEFMSFAGEDYRRRLIRKSEKKNTDGKTR
jgi:glutamate racemase